MRRAMHWVLVVSPLLFNALPAFAQGSIRGASIAEVDGARHIYIFKVKGDVVTGTHCTRCDEVENISIIRNGRIAGDRLSFTLLSSQSNGQWREQRVDGSIASGGILLRGVGAGTAEHRLARGPTRPAPAAPAPAAPAPPLYVAPGPPQRLTLEAMAGTWISGTGPRAQIVSLKVLDGTLVGLICGPCDTPWVMAPIEDGKVEGERVTIYTVHEDGGGMFEKLGPYRNELAGTVAKHQFRIRAHVDGKPDENVINMTFIGPVGR